MEVIYYWKEHPCVIITTKNFMAIM